MSRKGPREWIAWGWDIFTTALFVLGAIWLVWFTVSPLFKRIPPCDETGGYEVCRFAD